MRNSKRVAISVNEETAFWLRQLARESVLKNQTLDAVVRHLVRTAAECSRRPGALREHLIQALASVPEGVVADADGARERSMCSVYFKT